MNQIQSQFTWQAAIRKSDLSSNSKLVLLMLSLYMNHITTTAWPSNTTLASDTGLSKRAVQRALEEARDKGFIVKEQRFEQGKGQTSNLYHATIPMELIESSCVSLDATKSHPHDSQSPPQCLLDTPPVSVSHPNKPLNKQLNKRVEKQPKSLHSTTLSLELQEMGVNGVWYDFIDHRKQIRKPLTEKAESLIVSKLKKFTAEGMDATAVLEQSIENGWSGVFALKNGGHRHESNRLHRNRTAKRAIDSIAKSGDIELPDKL